MNTRIGIRIKGLGDTLALITSYETPLSFPEWLYVGKCYLDSEASYYPINQGYIGKAIQKLRLSLV
jgi:hypothetical protein